MLSSVKWATTDVQSCPVDPPLSVDIQEVKLSLFDGLHVQCIMMYTQINHVHTFFHS